MNARLLIIDPQNDFCDIPGAALPVPGADADLTRLAVFMHQAADRIDDITVTLDSHASVGIERTTFWRTGDGAEVAPFTQVTEADVRAGRFQPRDASRLDAVHAYLHALESGKRYKLVVWPVHCVLGTWGHNLHAAVARELAAWELDTQRPATRILKGMNPMTEQYSAVQAEVPDARDSRTQANPLLIARARPGDGVLIVAGEAASHCVAATMEHLLNTMSVAEHERVVLLRDCMSPVPSFEAQAEAFFAVSRAVGARILTCSEALAALDHA